ncbi:hypothetical protein Smp_000250 [Schistosoma mansoni]|uniref:Transposase n=1 Tax=Schistosoma mansoni TaxID=6183 RepID=G4LVS5_SCHMA|nr:hypothetical protein Smp_000250 [Schistosoma mansoni]|eukprot:XP_018645372.1 hypothetical protein Smp_000250 [Schistosoma mansoni]
MPVFLLSNVKGANISRIISATQHCLKIRKQSEGTLVQHGDMFTAQKPGNNFPDAS